MTGTVPPNGPPHDPANSWHPQGATYLNPIAPPIAPHQLRKPWPSWVIALIGLVSVGLLGLFAFIGAALEDEPEPGATAGIGTPAPYDALPGQTASAVKEAGGREACAAVKKALAVGGRLDPVAMASIAATGVTSRNVSIQLASQSLDGRAELAVAARGAPDEQRMLDGLAEAARRLEEVCATHGYYQP